MGRFYRVLPEPWYEDYYKEYAEIDDRTIPYSLSLACHRSYFEEIEKNEIIQFGVTERSANAYPDYFKERDIPIISERLKNIFDDFGINTLLYKKIVLKKFVQDRWSDESAHECWLAVPHKIDCLDFEKTILSPVTRSVRRNLTIDESKVGNNDIFKIQGRESWSLAYPDIVVSGNLHDYIIQKQKEENFELKGFYMILIQE